MTERQNGAMKKIIIGVVTVLIAGIIGQVAINSNRISILETEMKTFRESLRTNKDDLSREIARNRDENRDDHKNILNKIDNMNTNLVEHMNKGK